MSQSLRNIIGAVLESIPDVAILFEVKDGQFTFLKANKAARIAGFRGERKCVLNFKNVLNQVYLSGSSISYEGNTIFTPIFDDEGTCTHIIGMARDRPEQKEELIRTNTFLESLLSSTTDGILVTDVDQKIIRINQGFTSLFGWDEKDLIGEPGGHIDFIPEGYEEENKDLYMELLRGRNRPFYRTIRKKKDGRLLHVNASYSAILGTDGEITGLIATYRDISEQIEKEQQLEISRQRYESLFKHHPDVVFQFDLQGLFENANHALEEITGYALNELIGRSFIPLITPESLDLARENFQAVVHGETRNYECSIFNKQGECVDLDITSIPIIVNESITGVFGIARNTSEKKIQERRIEESEERYRLIAENMTDLVALIDANSTVLYASPSYQTVVGIQIKEGDSLLSERIHEGDFQRVTDCIKNVLETHQDEALEYRFMHGDGHFIWLDKKLTAVFDNNGEFQHVLCVSREVTERKQQEKELEKMAFYDFLTGASNRRLFMDRLTETMEEAKRNQKAFAVMCFDFDRFKWVNDTLGHDVGDELLIQFAKRLRTCIRKGDTLARLGGDEFAVLLPGVSSKGEIEEMAKRFLTTLQDTWHIKGHEFMTTSSIGIGTYPQCGSDVLALMKHVDQALYKAKQFGRNNYQFCSHNVKLDKAEAFVSFEDNVQRAIRNNEFYLVYQPKFNLSTKRVEAAEALIRWAHPTKGLVVPNDFIARAEENDLIIPITQWVLEQVGKQIKEWQVAGFKDIPISVNISPNHFEKGTLVEDVLTMIEKTGINPKSLIIEMTERTMVHDVEKTIETIKQLKEIGLKMAIDDFGTGYSSLSYLMKLQVDILKLDKSFVQELTDQKNASLVHSIVSLAHHLNLCVVAEGIETEDQYNILKQYGCDSGQGYFFSKPLMSDQLERVFLSKI
ncbi:sensor domain-containing protein [Halalkalibacter nanhaiisediminis]|uniref:PAS domain S-box-containing protein/diguanylate cyclase (GGDEF)-like protein n=1 Tax=Halalkalibacter nanhaiisediminis TaxID=688079 RepID=A0A562QSY9_9BACI|nr:GGDEF and EAL domain-containing protein [Halalkalibacter nanhaiisediminis]TWI59862.1 PAS domain S-box-containing protein/diguanylate cyclase (GGDEF)-like protein [Halalkalibacter nanhaiisediminis]